MIAVDGELAAQSEAIESREDFVRFLKALGEDFGRHGGTWENPTLGTFLEALSAWAESCPNYYRNTGSELNPNEPQWRVFADMLCAARVYE